eukprot:scaffold13277_cov114-Isochrysis_galbana.AAC.7
MDARDRERRAATCRRHRCMPALRCSPRENPIRMARRRPSMHRRVHRRSAAYARSPSPRPAASSRDLFRRPAACSRNRARRVPKWAPAAHANSVTSANAARRAAEAAEAATAARPRRRAEWYAKRSADAEATLRFCAEE